MGRYWVVLGVLGQYNLVMFSVKRYWVSKVFLCQYILKKWRFGWASPIPDRHTHTYRQENIGLLSLSTSLKFKLSHAIN